MRLLLVLLTLAGRHWGVLYNTSHPAITRSLPSYNTLQWTNYIRTLTPCHHSLLTLVQHPARDGKLHQNSHFCEDLCIIFLLTLQVTRAENRPKCTCLCCNNFHFHHAKLTRENLVSLDSWQIFLDRVYFFLTFSDWFFAVEFKKHVIQLLPIFGRFYYVQMNEFTHPFIKSTPQHIRYQKKALWVANLPKINHVGSVHSANQNHDLKCSVTDPAKPKLKTKWRRGKQLFIRFVTFLWINSSFCIDILTKCLTVFINKVIILVHVVWLTFLWPGAWVATVTSAAAIGRLDSMYFYVEKNHKYHSSHRICFIFVLFRS